LYNFSSKEVASAVSACLKASGSWSGMTQSSRAEALRKLSAALEKSEAAYAQLLNDYGVEGAKLAGHEIKAATQSLSKWCAKAATNQVIINNHKSNFEHVFFRTKTTFGRVLTRSLIFWGQFVIFVCKH